MTTPGAGASPDEPVAPASSARVLPSADPSAAAVASPAEARSEAERKVNSQLLAAIEQRQSGDTAGISTVEIDAQGRTPVEIRATISDKLLARIAELGGNVRSSHPGYDSIYADMPLEGIVPLAGEPAVRQINPELGPITRPGRTR